MNLREAWVAAMSFSHNFDYAIIKVGGVFDRMGFSRVQSIFPN